MVLVPSSFEKQILSCPFITKDAVEVIAHDRERLDKVVLVDTPDYDSEEVSNREIADDFFIISDLIILVTSQGKYSDLAGHVMADAALDWGKRILFLMNKVDSEEAWKHFVDVLKEKGYSGPVVKIERIAPAPEVIPDLRNRAAFRYLLERDSASKVRIDELGNLRKKSAHQINGLKLALSAEIDAIYSIVSKVGELYRDAETDMLSATDNLIRSDLQGRIEDRLKTLLRKYDVFSLPRSMVRQAVKKAFQTLGEALGTGEKNLFERARGQTERSRRNIPRDRNCGRFGAFGIRSRHAESANRRPFRRYSRQRRPNVHYQRGGPEMGT